MKSLKEVKKITEIETPNLRQRIARGTLKATKIGRDWFVKDTEVKRLVKEIKKYKYRK